MPARGRGASGYVGDGDKNLTKRGFVTLRMRATFRRTGGVMRSLRLLETTD
jgi:hypothetical protein